MRRYISDLFNLSVDHVGWLIILVPQNRVNFGVDRMARLFVVWCFRVQDPLNKALMVQLTSILLCTSSLSLATYTKVHGHFSCMSNLMFFLLSIESH